MNLFEAFSTWAVRRQLTSCGPNLRAHNRGLLFKGNQSEIHIGSGVLLERGVKFSLADNAKILIGDNSYIGQESHLIAVKEIRIGKGCAISCHVLMMDTSAHPLGRKGEKLEEKIGPIIIGDHVWIGYRAVILKGVTVGEGAIIATNAVVTRDVAPYSMVGGNPAQVLKTEIDWK